MEEIVAKPFLTQKETFVVCLNTMGMDRTFTNDERLAALRLVQQYRDIWEMSEEEHLKADIEVTIKSMEEDRKYRDTYDALDNAEIEARVEEMCAPKNGDQPLTEEEHAFEVRKAKMAIATEAFFAPEKALLH